MPATPISPICSQRAPAMSTITAATISMLPAVDRFGCKRISRNIAPGTMKSGTRPVKNLRTSLPGALRARARKRIMAYLASSEGWKLNRPQPQPAPRAVEQLAHAGDGHQAEQREADDHEGGHHRGMGELAVIDAENDEHQKRPRADAGELGGDFREGVALVLRVVVAGGVEHHQAGQEKQQEGKQHAPVDAAGQAMFGSRSFTIRLNSRPRAS